MTMYTLQLTDLSTNASVEFALQEQEVQQSAVQAIGDLLAADATSLINAQRVAPSAATDITKLQQSLFEQDEHGISIRADVAVTCQGHVIDPDQPLQREFRKLPGSSEHYYCSAVIEHISDQDEQAGSSLLELARIFFIYQIAEGRHVDVINVEGKLQPLIEWGENEELIEIDVQKAQYKLTAKGRDLQQQIQREMTSLIERYDIYGDVDIDNAGTIRFDTGLGKDLRVPAWEMEGVNPFRARFLLGLNDQEWNNLPWSEKILDPSWYSSIFQVIETAPAVEDVGSEIMQQVMNQGKSVLRSDSHFST
jgi:hypothetical protein